MDIYHTIIRPLVTEKGSHQASSGDEQHGGAYSFEVHPEANKTQIRQAVERIYNVRVTDVRTSNRPGKVRRYRFRFGRTRKTKKAVVVLAAGQHIDLF
ncbi:MAG: 50S ribosomal protein L23 [Phycisphaerae bacterium]|nr:50S ribosomal protein L23 [Phycisphaerae bacterium]